MTRVEGYIQFVLQLMLVAILEDKVHEDEMSDVTAGSFVANILTKHANVGIPGYPTILSVLNALAGIEAFKACEPKIKLIIHRLKQRQQRTFLSASAALNLSLERMDTASPASFSMPDDELRKREGKERAAKVIAAFKEQQVQFMANQDIDWGVDDFSDLEDDFAPVSEEKVLKYPSGTCILCQEETDDQRLYGTFAYISESTILRQTDTKDEDWVAEASNTPINLDHSADPIRPFGVAGMNRRMVEKVTSDGNVMITERQELGKGFPCAHARRGPVTIGCGHIMHYSCFDVYIEATKRRHVNQIARNHPERPDVKEFLCPLCKALGNAFLPIVWKGKTITYPGVLETEISFNDWIGSSLAVQISKMDKTHEKSRAERQQNLFLDYGKQEMIPQLASRLPDLMKATFISTPPVPQPAHQHRFQVPAFLPLPTQEDPRDPIVLPSDGNAENAQSLSLMELNRIYQRLKESMRANGLHSRFAYPHTSSMNTLEDLTYTDTLAKALGFSISAVEIAQRGVESDVLRTTLLDKISPQSLTHLRVFSETVSSYFTVGGLRHSGASKTCQEFMDSRDRQLHQLFVGHPRVFPQNALPYEAKGIPPLLHQDPFVFLAECAVCCVPSHHLDISHMLRLCYLAELVRIVVAYAADDSSNPFGSPEDAPLIDVPKVHGHWPRPESFINPAKSHASEREIHALSSFAGRIVNTARLHDFPASALIGNDADFIAAKTLGDVNFFRFLHTMMETYALPFLRKAAILMHVRYGIDFPLTPHAVSDEREMVRLTSLLKLPSLYEIFSDFTTDTPGGEATRATVAGWLRHWCWSREGKRPARPTISLAHPAIFELVGLPRNYDTLTDEAIRRKCPTTGKELTDPCVCLFCGEIFCSQAVCCMKDRNKGGCFQHQTK
jgi:E3 ubiquitin-protein ligase UBR1